VTTQPEWPTALRELANARKIEVKTLGSTREACEPSLLAHCDGIIIHDPDGADTSEDITEQHLLAETLSGARIMGIILTSGWHGSVPVGEESMPWIRLPEDVSPEELWGRVSTIHQYHPLLRRMDEHVSAMQRLGKKLNQHFVEVDQELRLASRLQRDFLPKHLPELNNIRFATFYRPATWVSGDVYDVRRLDEDTIAFYLMDAVGHGVSAGLLTMFLRQSIVGKRITNGQYEDRSASRGSGTAQSGPCTSGTAQLPVRDRPLRNNQYADTRTRLCPRRAPPPDPRLVRRAMRRVEGDRRAAGHIR
jgi:hypothetical protein